MYRGIVVTPDDSLVVNGESYKVRLTIKERLLLKPWSFFKATQTVTPKIPDPDFTIVSRDWLGNPLIVKGHPETIAKLDM